MPDQAIPRPVLITRPEPGATETARAVAALGCLPVVVPLQDIVTLPARLPSASRCQAILLTSRHAIGPVPSAYRNTPVWAVGAATADRARAAGFVNVRAAAGDSAALTEAVIADLDRRRDRILLVTGQGHGLTLARGLREAGFRLFRRVVYRTRAATTLPDAAIATLAAPDAATVLLYSANAARVFLGLVRRHGLLPQLARHDAVVISPAVAREIIDPVPSTGYDSSLNKADRVRWRQVRIAASPDQAAMISQL